MKKVEILAICSHEGILQTIMRLINNNQQWNSTGAAGVQQATDLISSNSFDLVLVGSGLTAGDELALETMMAAHKNIPVIKHYGGGSGLLFGEIFEALGKR